jgi:tRNA(Ile)-lysidine synthase TilS/MesJ
MLLCREHFREDVRRKARESLRKTGLFGQRARIIIELDGGRNSAALASILKDTFLARRDIDLQAVLIDDGDAKSPAAAEAERHAELLEIPLQRKSLLHLDNQGPGETTGLEARMDILHQYAREKQAGIIATCQDLDDEALEIFLRYLRGDCSPYEKERADVHWIKPLRRIPKKEVRLYAHTGGLCCRPDHESYQEGVYKQAKRLLSEFDSRHPGTNYSLLRGWERLQRPGGAKPLSKDGK